MVENNNNPGLDTPRKILRAIYHQHGENLLNNPQLFKALFDDHRKGQFILERNLIIQSFSENIPSEIANKSDQISFELLRPRLIRQLHEKQGMVPERAEWVVDSWATAFDIDIQHSITVEKNLTKRQDGKTGSQSHQKERKYTIFFTSNPPGASLFHEKKKIGNTPFEEKFAKEEYKFLCKLYGYHDSEKTVTITGGQTVSFNLKKQAENVVISTEPSGATVVLDGKLQGYSPVTIKDVSYGSHKLTCSKDNFITSDLVINVPTRLDYHVRLDPEPKVSITSSPSGATIFLDGNYMGVTPCTIKHISDGFHKVWCKINDSEEIKEIQIPRDSNVNFDLTPKTGILSVTSVPIGANVWIDGVFKGYTPVGIHSVQYGSHQIFLSLPRYSDYHQIITVPDDGALHVQLEKGQNAPPSPYPLGPVGKPPGKPSPIHSKPVGKFPQGPSTPGRNYGLLYWMVFCVILLFAGLVVWNSFSVLSTNPQNTRDPVSDTPSPVSSPMINQTDTLALQTGISLLNSGNYGDALKEFDKAISANPESAAAWNYKALSLFKQGRYDEAIQASDRTISLDTNNSAAWTLKGNTLNMMGNYSQAIPVFDHAISLNAENPDAWSGKGVSYYSIHDYSAATDSFDHALRISPKDMVSLEYRGRSLQANRKFSDAVRVYDSILNENPGNMQILINKGDCLNALGDFKNASSVFMQILGTDPSNKRALTGKGTSLLGEGKHAEAVATFNDVLSKDPRSLDALIGKSRALGKLNNYYEGLDAANKALDIDPMNAAAWISKAEIWSAQAKYSDALRAYDMALKFNPESFEALAGKAKVLISMDEYDGAITILEKLTVLYPYNKDIWNDMGRAQMKKGENTNAVFSFDKAIALDPRYTEAWNNKGYALIGAGEYNQSILTFDKVIEINPNYKNAWIGKSIALTNLGDFKASEEAARQGMSITLPK